MTTQAADPAMSNEVPREAWLALIIATLVFFLVVVDVSAVNVAFPSIARDFGVTETTLGWILSGYNITVAALLMLSGRLADSLGRKKMFIPGVAVFGLGSALCALAPNTGLLVAAARRTGHRRSHRVANRHRRCAP